MGIDWSAFSWEAFATLTTGLGAVAGATLVGLRQVGIQRRQADIQEKQVDIARLEIASGLFDKRMEVYSSIVHAIGTILSRNDTNTRSRVGMVKAVNHSAFLFSKETLIRIDKLHSLFLRHEAIRGRCDPNHWCIFEKDRDIDLKEVVKRMRKEVDDDFTPFMATQMRMNTDI